MRARDGRLCGGRFRVEGLRMVSFCGGGSECIGRAELLIFFGEFP